ncbi:MAG: NAD(P)/FAD-dependent oxidoreductase [Elusimicrobiota bacterium]
MKRRDAVIVGGGPAGLTAGFYLARAGFSTLLLEAGQLGGRAARIPTLHNYPGFPLGIAGRTLMRRMVRQAACWGLDTECAQVRLLEHRADGWRIELAGGEVRRGKAVLIATGTEFLPLGVPGERPLTGKGVRHAVFDNARRYAGRRVGVVGGGEAAAHQALALAKHAEKVVLFVRGREIKAIRPLRDALANSSRIELRRGVRVRRLLGDRRLAGVEWERGARRRREELDALFVLVGQRPHLPARRGTGGKRSLFIAGDARRGAVRHVVAAAADGMARAMECERFLRGWTK